MVTLIQFKLEEDPLIYIHLGLIFLSLLGSFFVLLMFLVCKKLRTFAFKLIAMLSLADFLSSLCYLYAEINIKKLMNNGPECMIIAYFNSVFPMSSFIVVNLIAYLVYLTVVKKETEIDSYLCSFVGYAFGFPMIYSVIPFLFGAYGYTGKLENCWIRQRKEYT